MGYEDFLKNQIKISNTQNIWTHVVEFPERFKTSVEKNAKIIFYEDLYNQLPNDEKNKIDSPEELKDCLKMYFKCENITYNFIKSYKDFVIKKFENGYLWDKITSDKRYEAYFKEVEFIDKEVEQKSVGIMYGKMFELLKKNYPKYITTKRDMKSILTKYFNKNDIQFEFINDEDEYNDYSNKIVKKYLNK